MVKHTVVVDLHLILREGAKILFGLRKNTGFSDGMYHLPAGHLEDNETILTGTAREAKEELSIDIDVPDLELVHTMHQRSGRVSLFFEVARWSGEVTNAEPDKCERLSWIASDRLPPNLVPYARAALEKIQLGYRVSVFGWDELTNA